MKGKLDRAARDQGISVRQLLINVLLDHKNITDAAAALGVTRNSLYYRLRVEGITIEKQVVVDGEPV